MSLRHIYRSIGGVLVIGLGLWSEFSCSPTSMDVAYENNLEIVPPLQPISPEDFQLLEGTESKTQIQGFQNNSNIITVVVNKSDENFQDAINFLGARDVLSLLGEADFYEFYYQVPQPANKMSSLSLVNGEGGAARMGGRVRPPGEGVGEPRSGTGTGGEVGAPEVKPPAGKASEEGVSRSADTASGARVGGSSAGAGLTRGSGGPIETVRFLRRGQGTGGGVFVRKDPEPGQRGADRSGPGNSGWEQQAAASRVEDTKNLSGIGASGQKAAVRRPPRVTGQAGAESVGAKSDIGGISRSEQSAVARIYNPLEAREVSTHRRSDVSTREEAAFSRPDYASKPYAATDRTQAQMLSRMQEVGQDLRTGQAGKDAAMRARRTGQEDFGMTKGQLEAIPETLFRMQSHMSGAPEMEAVFRDGIEAPAFRAAPATRGQAGERIVYSENPFYASKGGKQAEESGALSTTTEGRLASEFGQFTSTDGRQDGPGSYTVYEIDASGREVKDRSVYLGGKSAYDKQEEVAIFGGVDPREIRGAHVIKDGKSEFFKNPYYQYKDDPERSRASYQAHL